MNRLTFALLVIAITTTYCGAEDNVPGATPNRSAIDPVGKTEMDDLASPEAVARFTAGLTTDWAVFVEDRAHSIRWAKSLPKRWLADLPGHTQTFQGKAQPGEFYVFQLGLFAARRDVGEVGLTFSDLTGPTGAIKRARMRCLNLGGVDRFGASFAKQVSVPKNTMQALWIGIDVPADAKGAYRGTIKVRDSSGGETVVAIELRVTGDVLNDHGDRDSWRLSRLRWLDSTIGLDDNVVTKPYVPIERDGNTLKILGRDLTIGPNGLPQQIRSMFNADNTAIDKNAGLSILTSPMRFVMETEAGPVTFGPAKVTFTRELRGAVNWTAASQSSDITLTVEGLLEYDGFVNCRCTIESTKPVKVKDIRLELTVAPDAATYFMGLGRRGCKCPASVDWKWDPKVNQDGFWLGSVNAGFKLQLYGTNWRTPLVNCYYYLRELLVPESWGGADGRSGGIRLTKFAGGGVQAIAYSGPREIKPGQPLAYNFNLFLTPFKTLATDEQWAVRYYHPGGEAEAEADLRETSRVKAKGANLLNIHQSREQNPTINYPYFDLSMPLLKKCVADAHKNGIKTKIYYTTREITNNLPELFAFWSMNGEIVCPGPGKHAKPLTNPGGPHPWLLEHLGETGYIPAWRDTLRGRYQGMLDLAVLTTPDSRLDNFYLEGLAFCLREIDIDGVYVDDTALDRKAFQRAHRIFEKAGKTFLADNHSWSHMNQWAGMTPSAYCYMQNYPYFHRLWYGEGFNYNASPDLWLVEMSGIPFGLMSEMLGRGNPWRGMVFGETDRLGWGGDPQPVWRLWDQFGMAGTQLQGFWNPDCPVKTDDKDVLATVFRKQGKSLVALASWAKTPTNIKLQINWKALGLDPAKATLHAPTIDRLQPEKSWKPSDSITVEPGKGWMIVVE